MKLFQPYGQVSIDERMVQNKGWYSFRQYVKDKPTKWVLADADTGYTYHFDVVMQLIKSLFGQGYRLFVDNFYSPVQLCKDLLANKITMCGTILINRRGIPSQMKLKKKIKQHGVCKWIREGNIVFIQWQDNKKVTFISSISKKANKFIHCKRRTKVNGIFRPICVRQPTLVSDYNKYMSGVDKSDQLIGKYNILSRTNRYWKTLFYFLDIVRVNSYIMFQEWRKCNNNNELERPAHYGQLEFSIELMKQLACIVNYFRIPIYESTGPKSTDHPVNPKWSEKIKLTVRCVIYYIFFKAGDHGDLCDLWPSFMCY